MLVWLAGTAVTGRKEVAGLWEMPRTILKREDDMFEEMVRTYFVYG